MANVWQLQGYVALAHRAAHAIGAPSDSVVKAILALWACEQPNPAPWPPIHDNVGNLTRLIGSLGGPPPPVARTAPGVGLLYVYPTPEAGADAFARYLLTSARYRTAIAAARAGDGRTFIIRVCANGYGTRLSCVLGELPRVTLPAPPPRFHHWRCTADQVRVRIAPNGGASVIGFHRTGDVIVGPVVHGGGYPFHGQVHSTWIEASPGHYTASAYWQQL